MDRSPLQSSRPATTTTTGDRLNPAHLRSGVALLHLSCLAAEKVREEKSPEFCHVGFRFVDWIFDSMDCGSFSWNSRVRFDPLFFSIGEEEGWTPSVVRDRHGFLVP